jgi:hypothetical protein
MALKNLNGEHPHVRALRNAEKLAQERVDDDCLNELHRVGVLWAGILNSDHVIPPTEVAAMLAAYELIRASRLVDAEPHWTNVAQFAAIGAFLESVEVSVEEDGPVDGFSGNSNIGFTAKI